jgi:hypothetical protein
LSNIHPTTEVVSYTVNYKTEDNVTVTLHDATGSLITILYSEKVLTGLKSYTFNIKDYSRSKGIFYLSVNGNNIQATEKIIVL